MQPETNASFETENGVIGSWSLFTAVRLLTRFVPAAVYSSTRHIGTRSRMEFEHANRDRVFRIFDLRVIAQLIFLV